MCRHFEVGRCKMGRNCNFSHGPQYDSSRQTDKGGLKEPSKGERTDPTRGRDPIHNLEILLDQFVDYQRGRIVELRQQTHDFGKEEAQAVNQKVGSVDFQDRRNAAVVAPHVPGLRSGVE